MARLYDHLSEICEAAVVIDLESREIWDYPAIPFKRAPDFGPANPPTHTFLIYWPGGLFSYVVCKYTLEQLAPNFIESVHASAKFLKPAIARKLRM